MDCVIFIFKTYFIEILEQCNACMRNEISPKRWSITVWTATGVSAVRPPVALSSGGLGNTSQTPAWLSSYTPDDCGSVWAPQHKHVPSLLISLIIVNLNHMQNAFKLPLNKTVSYVIISVPAATVSNDYWQIFYVCTNWPVLQQGPLRAVSGSRPPGWVFNSLEESPESSKITSRKAPAPTSQVANCEGGQESSQSLSSKWVHCLQPEHCLTSANHLLGSSWATPKLTTQVYWLYTWAQPWYAAEPQLSLSGRLDFHTHISSTI